MVNYRLVIERYKGGFKADLYVGRKKVSNRIGTTVSDDIILLESNLYRRNAKILVKNPKISKLEIKFSGDDLR